MSRFWLFPLCTVLLAVLSLLAQTPETQTPETAVAPGQDAEDPLQRFAIHVTDGAAAGYVDDRLCSRCHSDIARSFEDVAMSKSFYRPQAATAVEDFDTTFEHTPSHRFYEMQHDGDRYTFRRYQKDAAGREINQFEVDVDWILGSGNHARTYLYQTQVGELYQLPLAWYAADGNGRDGRWGMAPGFDNSRHQGIQRIVQRECMFCHNAYPEVEEGSDQQGKPQFFPTDLPEGIGCQRCHGPGAEHVRVALAGTNPAAETGRQVGSEVQGTGEATPHPLIDSIINPGRLPIEQRTEVCASCHLQPTVAIAGLRRFGRPVYSYRVGEPLEDYFVNVDIDEADTPRDERFEINHHPYRLQQSRCFVESGGALSCLTCHDPHRKVPATERASHYRAACMTCHTVDSCQLDAMAAKGENDMIDRSIAKDNCVACHMPRRRPTDVIEVVMTDHAIQRNPNFEALLAPRTESTPVAVGVDLVGHARPTGSVAEVYRAIAVERAGGQAESLAHLQRHLPKAEIDDPEPWHQLLRGQVRTRQHEEAAILGLDLSRLFPEDPRILNLLALTQLRSGDLDQGVETLRQARDIEPRRPEGSFNLGRTLLARNQPEEALPHLEKAVVLRPNFVSAWFQLGQAQRKMGHLDAAIESYRRALAIEPTLGAGYAALVDLLLANGRFEEAERWWKHGREYANDPEALEERFPKFGPT